MGQSARFHSMSIFGSLAILSVCEQGFSQESRLVGLVDFSQETTILSRLDRGVRIQIAPISLDGFNIGRAPAAEPMSPQEATGLLSAYCSLGQIIDNPASRTVTVRLVPREIEYLTPQQVERSLGTAMERRGDNSAISFVVSTPDEQRLVAAERVNDARMLFQETARFRQISGSRFLAFDGVVLALRGSARGPQDRLQVLETALTRARQFNEQIKTPADIGQQRALTIEYMAEMDQMFNQLDTRGLMTDRLAVYQSLWTVAYAPAIRSNTVTAGLLSGMLAFNGNLADADNPAKCTTYVTGAKGSGATIQYAKPTDARAGSWLEGPRPTMDALELDRGFYSFRLLRSGTETGKRESVDCDRPSQGVEVPEQ